MNGDILVLKWTPRASTAGGGDHYKRAAMPTPPVEPARTTRSASRLCGDGGTAGGGQKHPEKERGIRKE